MTNENPETGNPATEMMPVDDSYTAVPAQENTSSQVEKAISDLATGPSVHQDGAADCPKRLSLQSETGFIGIDYQASIIPE